MYVPFASYIYFCKPGNEYLNAYRVRPEDVLSVLPNERVQVPWLDTPLRWSGVDELNAAHSHAWQEVWSSDRRSVNVSIASADLEAEGQRFVSDMAASYPRAVLPRPIEVKLRESGRYLSIDVAKRTFKLSDEFHGDPKTKVDVEVGDDDFLFFMKFPWGADTLNITGNIYINSQFRWRWLAYLKHVRYTHGHVPALARAALAIGGAAVRAMQNS